jgi:hypothetical protein
MSNFVARTNPPILRRKTVLGVGKHIRPTTLEGTIRDGAVNGGSKQSEAPELVSTAQGRANPKRPGTAKIRRAILTEALANNGQLG